MAQMFAIANHTRTKVAGIPFSAIKDHILGTRYELSVALLTPAEATRVTLETKKKDKASNVLAFPLSKTSGEILLCPATARTQARDYSMTPHTFLAYLFIHGCLHLKGMQHGATMESEECRVLKHFDLRTTDE